MADYERVLAALKELRQDGPHQLDLGICYHVQFIVDPDFEDDDLDAEGILKEAFYTWPEYSGEPGFPIKHQGMTASHAFYAANNMWGRDTEYGRARWRLLDHCIKHFEEVVHEHA